jgi:hypothetical protein
MLSEHKNKQSQMTWTLTNGKGYESDHGLFKGTTLSFVWTETEKSTNDHNHNS